MWTWSRTVVSQPIRTDYAYHAWTGELTQVDYPDDGTPRVDFTYNRMGRAATVSQQNVADWTYTYSDTLTLEKEDIAEAFGAGLYDKLITREYEPRPSSFEPIPDGSVFGRLKKIQVGTSADPDADYLSTYTYVVFSPHMSMLERVKGPGLPTAGPSTSTWPTGS